MLVQYEIIERKREIRHLNCKFKKNKELGWEPKFNSIDEMIIHSYNWINKLKYKNY